MQVAFPLACRRCGLRYAAVLLGALAGAYAGPLAGVLTALAGLASAALWAVAADRRAKVRARTGLLEDADRKLSPPGKKSVLPEMASAGFAGYLRPEAAVV